MSLTETIHHDAIAAQKSRDTGKLGVLRMLRAAIKNMAIEKRRELSDDEAIAVIRTEVKRLRDAMQDFERGARGDLVSKAQTELGVLEHYLPAMMSEDEVRNIVRAKVSSGVVDQKQIGKLTGLIMGAHKGKIEGSMLSRILKEEIGNT